MERGEKMVERLMPFYLDFNAKQLVCFDIETGEEVRRYECDDTDLQLELHDQDGVEKGEGEEDDNKNSEQEGTGQDDEDDTDEPRADDFDEKEEQGR